MGRTRKSILPALIATALASTVAYAQDQESEEPKFLAPGLYTTTDEGKTFLIQEGETLEMGPGEAGYAGKDVRVAQGGSTVLALAADGNISEGDWLVSDADGKVTTAGAASQGTAQYFVGYALRDSAAEDQLIPVVVWPVRVDNPAP